MNKNHDHNEWLIIVNPNAGNGKGKKSWNNISSFLKKHELPYYVQFTNGRGHAIELTRANICNGCRKIISVGGDGTLNEIVNGIFTQEICPTKDIYLGMIPVGTGNDWGRMFGIPTDYEGAVNIISEFRVLLHDIGVVNYSLDKEVKKRYFINIAGLGFDAIVVKRTNMQKDKGKGGKLIYFINILMNLLSYKHCSAEIDIDGYKIASEIFTISIGNGRYSGGGMKQTPNAIPDDGLLDMTVIRKMGKAEIILNLKKLYDGTILSHPKIEGYRGKRIYITSDPDIYIEADGESFGHTPVEIKIMPQSLNIIYGTRIIQLA